MTTVAAVFLGIREALESAGVPYAVGGSWASTAFGEPRMTNNVDILAGFTAKNLVQFLGLLPEGFYIDNDEAAKALQSGKPFNVIYMPSVFKFDFFPASAFPLGAQELERAVLLSGTEISESPTPFVTPEDIVLAKLYWYREGGETSEVQWRDILGIIRSCAASLDHTYLMQGAETLHLPLLLKKALSEAR